ncbi:MAG: hypothetical protein ABWZ40_01945 [Caulobacterales bacterium]
MDAQGIKDALEFIETSQRNQPVLFVLAALGAWLTGFVQVIEYIRLCIRDKVNSAPLVVILYLFADDAAVTALHGRWFNDIGHPFFQQMWYGFLLSAVFEVIIIFLLLRHCRQQIFPGFNLAQSIGAYAFLQAVAIAFVLWLNDAMGDFFWLMTPMLCNAIGLVGAFGLLMHRRSRLGLSMAQAWALLLVNTIGNFLFFPMVSERFHTPYFMAFATALSLFGVVYVFLLWRAPRVHSVAQAI